MAGKKVEAERIFSEHIIRGYRVMALMMMVDQKLWDSLEHDLKVPAIYETFQWLIKKGIVQKKAGEYCLESESASRLKTLDPKLRRTIIRFYCATLYEEERARLAKRRAKR